MLLEEILFKAGISINAPSTGTYLHRTDVSHMPFNLHSQPHRRTRTIMRRDNTPNRPKSKQHQANHTHIRLKRALAAAAVAPVGCTQHSSSSAQSHAATPLHPHARRQLWPFARAKTDAEIGTSFALTRVTRHRVLHSQELAPFSPAPSRFGVGGRNASGGRSEAMRAKVGYIYTPLLSCHFSLPSCPSRSPKPRIQTSRTTNYTTSPHQTTNQSKLSQHGRLRPVLQLQLQLREGQLHLRTSFSPALVLIDPPRQLSINHQGVRH